MTIDELLHRAKTCCCVHPEHERLLFDIARVVEHLRKAIAIAHAKSNASELSEAWLSVCHAAEMEDV